VGCAPGFTLQEGKKASLWCLCSLRFSSVFLPCLSSVILQTYANLFTKHQRLHGPNPALGDVTLVLHAGLGLGGISIELDAPDAASVRVERGCEWGQDAW
jgi:hypothetical protein